MDKIKAYDRGWLIGLLEGEGCFSTHKGHGTNNFHPTISVVSTDHWSVKRCYAITGLGHITGPYPATGHGKKDLWYWRVTDRAGCALVMDLVQRRMSPRRRARIKEIREITKC